MKTMVIELTPPADRLVEHWAQSEQISPEQVVQELIVLGFETRLRELYARYRRAECSFGLSGTLQSFLDCCPSGAITT